MKIILLLIVTSSLFDASEFGFGIIIIERILKKHNNVILSIGNMHGGVLGCGVHF